MSLDALSRRLARIEARRGSNRITGLVNFPGHPPEIAADAVLNWRAWIADGRAHRSGSTLILRSSVLTLQEWTARFAPYAWRLH